MTPSSLAGAKGCMTPACADVRWFTQDRRLFARAGLGIVLRDSHAGSRVSFRLRKGARCTRPGHGNCVSWTSDPGFNPGERRSGIQGPCNDCRVWRRAYVIARASPTLPRKPERARTRIAAAAKLPRDCLGESQIFRCAERGDGKGRKKTPKIRQLADGSGAP